jgi:hypothetical protein
VTTSTVTSDEPMVKLMVDGARMSTYLSCGATQKKVEKVGEGERG